MSALARWLSWLEQTVLCTKRLWVRSFPLSPTSVNTSSAEDKKKDYTRAGTALQTLKSYPPVTPGTCRTNDWALLVSSLATSVTCPRTPSGGGAAGRAASPEGRASGSVSNRLHCTEARAGLLFLRLPRSHRSFIPPISGEVESTWNPHPPRPAHTEMSLSCLRRPGRPPFPGDTLLFGKKRQCLKMDLEVAGALWTKRCLTLIFRKERCSK